jgi:NAD(P)-dependent dehydrogenase (short-subunit alcohol dehydrogenase family)
VSDSPSRKGYALVTGGAVRLGAYIARRLAADGWNIAIHFHAHDAEARSLAAELAKAGVKTAIVSGDLGDAGALSSIFSRSNAALGFCSLLVNSASAFEYDEAGTVTAESMDRLYEVNFRAPVLLARHFAEQLPADEKGLIVNVLDQKVYNLNPDFFSYTLMKSALEAATRLLAMAMAPRVRVCGVAPGLTLRSGDQSEEGFREAHAKVPLGKGSTPEEIAESVAFLARVPSMTGTTLVVDGGQWLQKRRRDVMFSYGINPPGEDDGDDA